MAGFGSFIPKVGGSGSSRAVHKTTGKGFAGTYGGAAARKLASSRAAPRAQAARRKLNAKRPRVR